MASWFQKALGVFAVGWAADTFLDGAISSAISTGWGNLTSALGTATTGGGGGALGVSAADFGRNVSAGINPSWDVLTDPNAATASLAGQSGQAVLGGGGNFFDRAKDAIGRPENWVRAGLALAGGSGDTPGPVNQQAALAKYNAQDDAVNAENTALRQQQNNTATNLEESGGANAFRGAQVRGANEVEALKDKLGYSSAPSFVQDALVSKAQGRAGLNAQTSYATGDANARAAAAGMRKYAPTPNSSSVTLAAGLDTAKANAAKAKQSDYGAIGSAFEDIFGYKKEKNAANAGSEG